MRRTRKANGHKMGQLHQSAGGANPHATKYTQIIKFIRSQSSMVAKMKPPVKICAS
jgi:hypothetical protein